MLTLKQHAPHTQVVMLSSGGDPVTGVTHGAVSCFVSKNGTAPLAYTLTSSNFREISNAMMPGLYAVDFDAGITDTLGELVAVFLDKHGLDTFDQYATKYGVSPQVMGDLHGAITGAESTMLQAIASSTSTIGGDIGDVAGKADQIMMTQGADKSHILGAIAAVDQAVGVNEGKVDAIAFTLGGIDNKVDRIDTGSLASGIDQLNQDFQQRVPEAAALKRHLVSAGGAEDAPAGKGLWDVLGDGQVTLTGLWGATMRLLGLNHENFTITGHEYDAKNHLTKAKISLYPDAMAASSLSGAFATYEIVAAYDANDRLVHYEMVRKT